MAFTHRIVVAVTAAVALMGAAGCNSSSPTGASFLPFATEPGATIVGTVAGMGTVAGTGSSERAVAAVPGSMRVTVVGTDRAATVSASGRFQITGVPPGDVVLQFSDGTVNATAFLAGVSDGEQVDLEVDLSGTTASILRETRSAFKIELCHRTGNGRYRLIDVSVNAEATHRGHGDGEVGDLVPGSTTQERFGEDCQPAIIAVTLVKSTNGDDADRAPGPSIPMGTTVNWTYLVTNTGIVALTGIVVTDDQGVVVSCPGAVLAVGASMTCTGTGVAVLGPYVNIGTVNALAGATAVSASDVSRYLGIDPTAIDGPKVQLCHRTGNGSFHLIEVGAPAEPAHRAHGDGKVGEQVPGQTGSVFGPTCAVSAALPPV